MILLSVLLLLATKWSISETNGMWQVFMNNDMNEIILSINLDQCCQYFYASSPHNESNCIPEGQQLSLDCTIHNPRDSFTNLAVRWYRSSDMSALTEDFADIQSTEYKFYYHTPTMTSLRRNFTQGRLYATTFNLIINNFTTDKNGYYWCQILINDSFTQPSQYALFYADSNSCLRDDPYFRYVPDQAQCASIVTGIASLRLNYYNIIMNDITFPGTIFTSNDSHINATDVSTTPATTSTFFTTLTSEMTETSIEPITYVVGILAAVVLLIGALVILMLIASVYKSQKEKKQRHSELIMIMLLLGILSPA